ncbi:hypothetical protein BDV96DRAFT_120679 [Lophiotrema nucula]|uniref:Secreted protein n=1 Tax=Lophiotrema nucula TaxID=690887 RepID=A0A6A5Z2S0_9PLEO|nr:hypothetical protein BDV96DRAFT_120679 [Lophiotrema nucula]
MIFFVLLYALFIFLNVDRLRLRELRTSFTSQSYWTRSTSSMWSNSWTSMPSSPGLTTYVLRVMLDTTKYSPRLPKKHVCFHVLCRLRERYSTAESIVLTENQATSPLSHRQKVLIE